MKKLGIIIYALIIVALIGCYIYYADFHPTNYNEELLKKIDKLELKIDSLSNKKDSIRSIIDSTHVKIITNEKHYQERINTILVQPASADSGFIADYIRQYSSKNSMSDIE